jgi:G3E family GTPase
VADRLPVVLVTGFLGSGKTTLIAALLRHPAMGEAAVLVNELGEAAIDHHLVRQVDERTIVMGSGCVCCTLRGDLRDELRDLLARRARGELPPFARVVVETTGLADPAPVISTLLTEPVLRHQYALEAVIVTVDAVNGAATLDRHAEAVKQAAVAGPPHAHAGDLRTFTLVLDEPLDWDAFAVWLTMLLHARGLDVLRVKALLDVGGAGPVLLDGVQHVVHPPRHLAAWPDADRRSRIVFITRGIEREAVEASLRAFAALGAPGLVP